MNERGPVTEHEMVLAFLQSEIDSARFGLHYQGILTQWGLNRASLIDQANLANADDNHFRTELLKSVRGYEANQYLFNGFPSHVQWRRVELEIVELTLLKYANFPTWITLSEGSRSVVDGAKNIERIQTDENASDNIKAVVKKVRNGHRFPELIAVQADGQDLILVEGHTRATAYVLAQPSYPIELLVGSSSLLKQWVFY
jgi:hypothetical protein